MCPPVASKGARGICAVSCIIVIRYSPTFDLVAFAGAAAFTDQGTTHCIPVVVPASLFLIVIAIDRAGTLFTISFVVLVGSTSNFVSWAWTANCLVRTAHCKPACIPTRVFCLGIALHGAWTMLAPSRIVLCGFSTAPDLSLRAWAANTEGFTVCCNPVVIPASLFSCRITVDRTWTGLAPTCIVLIGATFGFSLRTWAATLRDACASHGRARGAKACLFSSPIARHGHWRAGSRCCGCALLTASTKR
mmetsp:Transcript_19002/g.33477  ORF Transcript_19002/g.33477 Transcript_19002/m.33477 type:complete len:248 (+) Transcript_19002:1305-2048(+)